MTIEELNKSLLGDKETTTPRKPGRVKTVEDLNKFYEGVDISVPEPAPKTEPKQPFLVGSGLESLRPGSGYGTPFDWHVEAPVVNVKTPLGLGEGLNVILHTVASGLNNMNDIFDFGISFADKVKNNKIEEGDFLRAGATTLKAPLTMLQFAFLPISTELTVAENSGIPVVSQGAFLVNKAFEYLGVAGGWLANKALDVLPEKIVSQNAKEIFREPITEIGQAALPLLVGKLGPKALNELSQGKKLGTNYRITEEGTTTFKGIQPTTVAKVAGISGKTLNFFMSPFSLAANKITSSIKTKVGERARAGKEITPEESKRIINEAVKETPIEIPGTMEIRKVDESGKPKGESIIVDTKHKLVLQNLIPGREDLNYAKVNDLGRDTAGKSISARYEFNFNNKTGTIYYTNRSKIDDIVHEFGHHFDRQLTSEIGVKFSDYFGDYMNNKRSIDGTLVTYAFRELGDKVTKIQ